MRGTPLAIQLMIMAFLILAGKDKLVVACVAFGLNSAAYVSEVIRGISINSVDVGQMPDVLSVVFPESPPCAKSSCLRQQKHSPALCNERNCRVKRDIHR